MDKPTPYINEHGDLVIPFECADHTFKYWKKEGKTIRTVLEEMGADQDTLDRYVPEADEPKDPE